MAPLDDRPWSPTDEPDQPTWVEVTEDDIAPPGVWVHMIALPEPGWVLADCTEAADGGA